MLRRMAWSSIPSPSFSAARLGELIAAARQDNLDHHISGRLLYTGAHFLEIVEGDVEALDDLWSRMEGDDRHDDLIRIGDEPCDKRWFPGWTMGYADEDDVGEDVETIRRPQSSQALTWANATRSIMARADSM